MSIIVAITGLPRVGKDTLGSYLADILEGETLAIADPLYREVAAAFGVSVAELKSDAWKSKPNDWLAIWKCDDPDYRQMMHRRGEDVITPRTSRYHLRYWGTEYRRARDPHYWASAAGPALDRAGDRPIIITDMRAYDRTLTEYTYFREFAAQNEKKFCLVEVLREGAEWGHSSDDRFPDHLIDLSVTNEPGNPEAMFETVYNHLHCTHGAV